jgi:hypothetical protein
VCTPVCWRGVSGIIWRAGNTSRRLLAAELGSRRLRALLESPEIDQLRPPRPTGACLPMGRNPILPPRPTSVAPADASHEPEREPASAAADWRSTLGPCRRVSISEHHRRIGRPGGILPRSLHLPVAVTDGSLREKINETGVRLWTACSHLVYGCGRRRLTNLSTCSIEVASALLSLPPRDCRSLCDSATTPPA